MSIVLYCIVNPASVRTIKMLAIIHLPTNAFHAGNQVTTFSGVVATPKARYEVMNVQTPLLLM